MPAGKMTSAKPSASSSAAGRIGVLPPSTMLASSGTDLPKRRPMRSSSLRLRRFEEQHVGAGLAIEFGARSMARSKPSTRDRVGACDDERLARMAGIERGLDLADHFARRDQPLVVEMAAALGEVLIFDLDRVGAGALEHPHGALDVERIAVAGVGIDDQRHPNPVADQRSTRLHDFVHADEADVGRPSRV